MTPALFLAVVLEERDEEQWRDSGEGGGVEVKKEGEGCLPLHFLNLLLQDHQGMRR